MKISWTGRFGRQERGSAMIEFAIVTPMLMLLAFGVIDFGRAFYTYNALSSIVRDAARFGTDIGCTSFGTAAIQTRFQQTYAEFFGGLPANAPTPTVTPLGDGSIRVALTNYQFQAWTPVLPAARSLRFSVASEFRRLYSPPNCNST